jgi:UDP-N-acetylmuramyl pentapeptide phosphotransferase/UDP-N-acetylglucosamine-1-phosphate transferase
MFAPGFTPLVPSLVLPLLVVAVTAVINFVNFMDGRDGLVVSCLAVMLMVAAVKLSTPACMLLVDGLLGFLV